ncbi:MAG: thioredoxin fold domain-containing protein [Balneolaceae bacterium]|nr:thioredoxin fold domain-containing protein [Balneolaceae bacterium]
MLPDSSEKSAKINWYSLEEAQNLADDSGKKVLVYLEAQWCGYCNKMESEVFPLQEVQDVMHQFYYPVRVDIDSNNTLVFKDQKLTEKEFAQKLRVSGTPTFLFINGEGTMLGKQPGFMPADVFKALLSYVGSDLYDKMKFDQYLKEQTEKG